jgi:alpha-mannosidase
LSTGKEVYFPHPSRREFIRGCTALALASRAAAVCAEPANPPDLTHPTLYVVPYAHLDTQWHWEFPQVISEYLLKTFRVNFYLFDKYPHYIFNWTGANRYRLMKEYYPADYARMRRDVAAGRWFPAGSSVEENDVNLPSAESIFRQVLCGNTYFRRDFGKASSEYMLPDCFGFPASLPSILAHAGLKGFSTQKLSAAWQPAPKVGGPGSPEQTPDGIPFNVGIWEGPDGKTIIAALNPIRYAGGIRRDISQPLTGPPADRDDLDWVKRLDIDGKVTGVYADYHYVGTGDIGGAPDEETVRLLEAMVTHGEAVPPPPGYGGRTTSPPPPGTPVRFGEGPVRVLSTAANQMFDDITPAMTTRMPRYKGDLELINHSAGSLTSQAYHKRWNRKNEILADAAEKASVTAAWLGGREYPYQRLNDAWFLVMSGQFHDVAAGTATPRAYQFAWNDDVIALNQFAGVLTSAVQSLASAIDTNTEGFPCLVSNQLDRDREDVVEAEVAFAGGTPAAVRVVGPDGEEVPSQIENGKVLFVARVPSVGFAVYDIRSDNASAAKSALSVSENSLENQRYRVRLNSDGDVDSIFDKQLQRELLSAPMRLAISTDSPREYPAWNMDFDQEQAAPRAYVSGPAKIRIVENGPVRVALEVARETEKSRFVQTVRLSAGDAGNRVEFFDQIDWRAPSANLKAVFPLSATNLNATYNWEVGTIERPTATERQFEVASHHWIDLTDASGSYGATLLTDVKNGSDKRDDRTLRLTLLRTPGEGAGRSSKSNSYQFSQDWGHHEILYGIAGHEGDWRSSGTDWQAYRLSTPLIAFATGKHEGSLGKTFSLMRTSSPQVRVLALKRAEQGDELVVRLVELHGSNVEGVRVRFAGPIVAATEIDGQEQHLRPATIRDGVLETEFAPYQPRTFALRLGTPPARVKEVTSEPVPLNYDLAVASNDDTPCTEGFNGKGDAMPAEMLPALLAVNGVRFHLAPAATGKLNALRARGQSIQLPKGNFNRVYVLAASADGDQKVVFKTGSRSSEVTVPAWNGFIGQWDATVWKPSPATITVRNAEGTQQVALRKDWAISANHAQWDVADRGSPWWAPKYPDDYLGLVPGYIKRANLAWYASHHHTPEGLNQPYEYSYLFAIALDMEPGAHTLTLPENGKICILAVSVVSEGPGVTPAQPLYDTLAQTKGHLQDYLMRSSDRS